MSKRLLFLFLAVSFTAVFFEANVADASSHAECADGIDNDGDGFIDFGDDPECSHPLDPSESIPGVPADAGLVPCGGEGQAECHLCHVFVLTQNVVNFFLVPTLPNGGIPIVPVLAAVLLAAGGAFFLLGSGSPQNLQRGKQIIIVVLIALLLIYGSWLFINFVLDAVGVADWVGGGKWWEIDCAVPIIPTVDLAAFPPTAPPGVPVSLEWTVLNAISCEASADPPSSDWSGAKPISCKVKCKESITPDAGGGSQTYTLTCKGLEGGKNSDSVTVKIK